MSKNFMDLNDVFGINKVEIEGVVIFLNKIQKHDICQFILKMSVKKKKVVVTLINVSLYNNNCIKYHPILKNNQHIILRGIIDTSSYTDKKTGQRIKKVFIDCDYIKIIKEDVGYKISEEDILQSIKKDNTHNTEEVPF